MRCPKCQYIGFDSGNRCRNCGYDFSLAIEDDRPVDVSLDRGPEPGRMADLRLTMPPDAAGPAGLDEMVEADAHAHRRGARGEDDLPLFTSRVVDDQAPLVTPPAVPRPPLAVRRAGPPRHRARATPSEPSLDLRPHEPRPHAEAVTDDGHRGPGVASLSQRVSAGLIDVSLLGAIGAGVVYLTLQVAQLPTADWGLLPPVPLGAFLLLLCGGYFTIFTAAGGQTIGKMLARIRVVPEAGGAPRSIPFGTAFVRTLTCFGSVAAFGAGFLPALLREDRRAFHDRIADTRVVSA
jgi:uncharacterized RDD family membrane protein YckC